MFFSAMSLMASKTVASGGMDHKAELLWCSNELIGTLDFIGLIFLSTILAFLASKMFQLIFFPRRPFAANFHELFTKIWIHCRLSY